MKVSVILPAAGLSTRFGGTDKLAADLGGRPVLLRTVELFTRRPEVQQIIVAGPPDDFEAFVSRFGAALGFHGATVVPGGRRDRWETVRRALEEVDSNCSHVAVHDAARPLVSSRLLDRLLLAASRAVAVIPAQPVHATLKAVVPESVVDLGEEGAQVADAILGGAGRLEIPAVPVRETVDREGFALAQTPQIFRRETLMEAYRNDALDGVTDDAQVVEQAGHAVHVIAGEVTNLKITTPQDLQLAAALLSVVAADQAVDPFQG